MNRRMAGAGSSADADDLCSHPHPCGVEKGAGGDENRTGRMDDQKAKKDKEKDEESWQQEMLTVSTLPVRRRELLLWSWTRRSAKQHSPRKRVQHPTTTPVQTEKSKTALDDAGVITPGGEKYQRKQKPYSPPCSPDGVKGSHRRISLNENTHQGRLWQSEG